MVKLGIQNIFRGLLITLVCVILVACNGQKELQELRKSIKKQKTHKAQPIEPAPEFKIHPKFAYPENRDRRDPFIPIKRKIDTAGIRPDQKREKEILEEFSLDALRMVGTIRQGDRIWAMIHTPKGDVVKISVGNYMGLNYGRIDEITREKLYITEIVREDDGWSKRPAELVLREPEK